MTINQFLFDHQLAAMTADRSGSAKEREQAFEAMGGRAVQIAEWRNANGLSNLHTLRDVRRVAS